jgi:hypothetical protein
MSDSNNDEVVKYTKKSIILAQVNTLTVSNDAESYKEYFKLGGTVAKLSPVCTKNYAKFVQNRKNEKN